MIHGYEKNPQELVKDSRHMDFKILTWAAPGGILDIVHPDYVRQKEIDT